MAMDHIRDGATGDTEMQSEFHLYITYIFVSFV